MATSNPDEEFLSSIASLSPPPSLKSGTLDLPSVSDSLRLDINPTPEPTRHSPTPPPNNLHITIDNHPIPPKKI